MTERAQLVPLVAAFAKARVLCIGDVMLDHFHYGTVERISPEAPIPVLKVEREDAMLGGAGNVVRNLDALGANTHFVTVVGGEEKRDAERRAHERHNYPLRTVANVFFFIGLGTLFYMLAAFFLALQSAVVSILPSTVI